MIARALAAAILLLAPLPAEAQVPPDIARRLVELFDDVTAGLTG